MKSTPSKYPEKLRIIGGRWRGRKISFSQEGVRPTPDRVRETLFNWLREDIVDACCLDLFAGSGVLGFEALSRGASFVTWVDVSRNVLSSIRTHAELLKTDACELLEARIPEQFGVIRRSYDLVFLDPPFASEVLLQTVSFLQSSTLLNPLAKIYIETSINTILPSFEPWELLKSGRAGKVAYYLYQSCFKMLGMEQIYPSISEGSEAARSEQPEHIKHM